jgi:dihydroneopterin aldolase
VNGPADRISLRGLRAWGHHGVFDFEQDRGQEFIVDVELGVDTAPAAVSDGLADTVDYGRVAADVYAIVTRERYALLETLANRVAERCLAHPHVETVTVTVHKPGAPMPVPFDDVTVTVSRPRP